MPETRDEVTTWVGGQADYWKQQARNAEAVIESVRTYCDEIEAHCSANRLDAPPWVASVRAILHRSKETADHA